MITFANGDGGEDSEVRNQNLRASKEKRGGDLFGMRNLCFPFIEKGLLLSMAETRSMLSCFSHVKLFTTP